MSPPDQKPVHVFLGVDGNLLEPSLILSRPSGVFFGHQFGGERQLFRSLEGTLIPLGNPHLTTPLRALWKGLPIAHNMFEVPDLFAKLSEILNATELRVSTPDFFECEMLILEPILTVDCEDGWIPVRTQYGLGALVYDARS